MKEVTYTDWVKNPTPRVMWVWDDDEDAALQLKVIYLSKEDITYPVVALTDDENATYRYKHCAEIETTKPRRFTYKELSRWLREKPNREYMHITSDFICCHYDYREETQDKEVCKDIRIREDDGEWKEPLVEEIE